MRCLLINIRSLLLELRLLCKTPIFPFFFFFNDTATTEIYTLSLHDALPIFPRWIPEDHVEAGVVPQKHLWEDRKSTRLNSSHMSISYAVFCLKKKKKTF